MTSLLQLSRISFDSPGARSLGCQPRPAGRKLHRARGSEWRGQDDSLADRRWHAQGLLRNCPAGRQAARKIPRRECSRRSRWFRSNSTCLLTSRSSKSSSRAERHIGIASRPYARRPSRGGTGAGPRRCFRCAVDLQRTQRGRAPAGEDRARPGAAAEAAALTSRHRTSTSAARPN